MGSLQGNPRTATRKEWHAGQAGRHEEQEEVYVIVGGSGRVKLEDDVRELRQWDAVRVPKETMRSFEAGPEGLELIAFGAPGTGLNDAQQEQGWWAE